MPDLFNTPEPPQPPKKKFYKGNKGQFTSKQDARVYELEQERNKYLNNYKYYKRQAERLAQEVVQEKKRADALQSQINKLTKAGN